MLAEIPLGEKISMESGQLVLGEKLIPWEKILLPDDLSYSRISCEHIRHRFSTGLTVCGRKERLVNGRGTGNRYHVDRDAVLSAEGTVEFINESI